MLVPLTRKTFEDLIPAVATGAQYAYYWGKFSDFLKRLLISVVAVLIIFLLGQAFGDKGGGALELIIGIAAGLYWLWGPVALASFRNLSCRRYEYSGFWQGRVLDVYITDEIIGEEETVNSKGQLVIVENRERRLNIEVGDRTGFTTGLSVPLRKEHKAIANGQVALCVVMSKEANLNRIGKVSDIYIPTANVWVSDYPYLQRDVFEEVSRQIREAKRKEKLSRSGGNTPDAQTRGRGDAQKPKRTPRGADAVTPRRGEGKRET